MQRWGKTSSGKQRFFCPLCRGSSIRQRPDLRFKIDLRVFVSWLTTTTGLDATAKKLRISRSNLTRSFIHFWKFLPQPMPITCNSEVLVVDGVSVIKHYLVALIIYDRLRKIPLSWHFALRESYSSWVSIFLRLKAKGVNPQIIVCDGQKGLIKPSTLFGRMLSFKDA